MIFVSHDSKSRKEAKDFQKLIRQHTVHPARFCKEVPSVFLSSDATSIKSGEPWTSRIFDSLRECKSFAALIVQEQDFENQWIPFEAAFVMGRGDVDVNIFVFGQIKIRREGPLSCLHLIDTGDTDRVDAALQGMGVNWTKTCQEEFAHLFRQCGHYRTPQEPCPGIDLFHYPK